MIERRGRASPLAVVLFGLALLLGAGCRRRDGDAVALVLAEGIIEREVGAAWEPAPVGATFGRGDAIRTGASSRARLRFPNGRVLRLGADALVRFAASDGAGEGPTLSVEIGEAIVEGGGALLLQTDKGLARLDPGAGMRIRAGEASRRYEVLFGRAELVDGAVGWSAGEGIEISFGGAKVERYRIEIGKAQAEPLAAPRAPEASGAGGEAPVAPPEAGLAVDPPGGARPGAPAAEPPGGAPERAEPRADRPLPADVVVVAGESPVIHTRAVPVAVRVSLATACPGGGAVEVLGGRKGRPRARAEGEEGATVVLPAGRHRYRIVCRGGETKAAGALVLKRDPGTAPVPRSAPMNVIEADGRKYTVLYQNRPPALTFVWPNPPSGVEFELHVEAGGKARVFAAVEPRLRLSSGQIPEGAHRWWFATSRGVQSPRTSLEVRFDNAAATAQLQEPRDGLSPAEPEIDVAGIALEGSRVSVGGQPLVVDAHGRFRGRAPAPRPGERGIAVRLEHPRGGVHYYLRRLAAR